MIKINRSRDNQFYLTYVAKNGETLLVSKLLKRKQSAFVNIRALCGILRIDSTQVIEILDCTFKKPKTVVI